jgi:hypothetical protein
MNTNIFLLFSIITYLSLPHLSCRIQSSSTPGIKTTETGKRLQSDISKEKDNYLANLNQKSSLQQTNATTQNSLQQQTEEQKEAQRAQNLAANFITPINTINTLNQSINTIDKKLKQDIKKRKKKSKNASTKDLIANAQAKKTTTYAKIIASIQQLLNDTKSLPTGTELQQSLYHNAALKLGAIIQVLINNICEQPKKTTKMVIKKEYKGTIQLAAFLAMITKAAEFSRGFNNQQNTSIKRTLTMLAQGTLPTIRK